MPDAPRYYPFFVALFPPLSSEFFSFADIRFRQKDGRPTSFCVRDPPLGGRQGGQLNRFTSLTHSIGGLTKPEI